MNRAVLVALTSLSVGCIFSDNLEELNNATAAQNNTTAGPNNTTSNNTTMSNNGTTVLNNTIGPPNNTIGPPNNTIGPPNNVACPDAQPPPLCDAAFTCSPDAVVGCERCGLCDGICAPGPNGLLGLCVAVTPVVTMGDLSGEEPAGIGKSVAVDNSIFIGRPAYPGGGEVLVADIDGQLTATRLRAPAGATSGFGEAMDAANGRLVVGCPGCGTQGQVFLAENANSIPIPMVTPAGQHRIGAAVALLSNDAQTLVVSGSRSTQTVLLNLNGVESTFSQQIDEFGTVVAAAGEFFAVGSNAPEVVFRRNPVSAVPSVEAIALEQLMAVSKLAMSQSANRTWLAAANNEVVEVLDHTSNGWMHRTSLLMNSPVVAMTFTDLGLFVGLQSGEVRVFRIEADATDLGHFMIPGLTALDSNGTVVVAGAAGAQGPDAVFAYRIGVGTARR